MDNQIDHVTVGAANLTQGVTAIRDQLGVEIPPGGRHPAMSTHNCVAQTANDTFIEIIAVDPNAPDPGRRRWFSLDEDATQRRLQQAAQPLCWVVRTSALDTVLAASPIPLGEVVPLSRGELTWRLTVSEDGSLPFDGLLPAFIEWSPGPHPSRNMHDLGLRLHGVKLYHPDTERLRSLLAALSINQLAEVCEAKEPGLGFVIETADGRHHEVRRP